MEISLLPHDHGNAKKAALLRRELLRGGDFGTAAELFFVSGSPQVEARFLMRFPVP